MFNSVIRLGLLKRFKKGKINPTQALKEIEKFFKDEMQPIYREIAQFREGK